MQCLILLSRYRDASEGLTFAVDDFTFSLDSLRTHGHHTHDHKDQGDE